MKLDRGEVFVEVAPHGAEDVFVVKAPGRDVKALGTKFEVRADGDKTGVVVTQGKVQVSGLSDTLQAGQALGIDGRVEPAARASHLLDWTRDLMAAAESPLVPASAYAGGSLIAVDSNGQEAKLGLRKYTVDVHIEDGFARTTIDQTYFNQHPWRLEGTFYFPLPPDASLSRLAMYVSDGNENHLMEGGMAERSHARASLRSHRQQPARPGAARMGGRQHVQDARLPAGRPAGEAHHPQLHAAPAWPLRPGAIPLPRGPLDPDGARMELPRRRQGRRGTSL